jgi:hypothetical protein
LRSAQRLSPVAIFNSSQSLFILSTSQSLPYTEYCYRLWDQQHIATCVFLAPRILRLNVYRKPHHKFLQNFLVVGVSQVVMWVISQSSERVTGEGSFAKGFRNVI